MNILCIGYRGTDKIKECPDPDYRTLLRFQCPVDFGIIPAVYKHPYRKIIKHF